MTDDAPADTQKPRWRPLFGGVRSKIVLGLFTVLPIAIAWFVVAILIDWLSWFGKPLVIWVAEAAWPAYPAIANALLEPWTLTAFAVIAVLWVLYFVGFVASNVIGARVLTLVERVLDRVPLVKQVYGASKKLIQSLQQKPGGGMQRVVLIDFPNPEMKAIGFVTKIFKDETTGRDLAAVYVPTTPNPTSGYLEIVPVEKCVSTDLTADEAMNMILSGGATAPDSMRLTRPQA